ncbi:MAG TPA: GNAT family N-acetyltransferase [Bacillales bacterium]|nr:GNAT family N-acetyltransferase [Bacillales bacterium]
MNTKVSIKKLTTFKELEDIQILEKAIWGMEPLPVHQTFTVAKNGGLILGAFIDHKMVGFSYGFPGFQDGRTYLCSHMLGIDPDYQKQGIGRLLKEKQREAALELGYDLITWTFDPLLSVNAYLNLHHLKAIVAKYTENLYGEMDDQLNRGIPSDRFTVEWWIGSELGRQNYETVVRNEDNTLVDHSETKDLRHREDWFIPIPADFQRLKLENPDSALEWRLKTRRIFQELFRAGFVGADIRRSGDFSYYHFIKKDKL